MLNEVRVGFNSHYYRTGNYTERPDHPQAPNGIVRSPRSFRLPDRRQRPDAAEQQRKRLSASRRHDAVGQQRWAARYGSAGNTCARSTQHSVVSTAWVPSTRRRIPPTSKPCSRSGTMCRRGIWRRCRPLSGVTFGHRTVPNSLPEYAYGRVGAGRLADHLAADAEPRPADDPP